MVSKTKEMGFFRNIANPLNLVVNLQLIFILRVVHIFT